MAADNKPLGKFDLMGIPSAPRGIPQIEVTFDIDANGITSVSAKDMGTGKEQKITVTGSGNLSKDEIERMRKEAESNAADDEKKRSEVELVNQADSFVYTAEKTMKDFEGKVDEKTIKPLKATVEELKKLLEAKNRDLEALKKKMDEATKLMQEAATELYKKAGPPPDFSNMGSAGGAAGGGGHDSGHGKKKKGKGEDEAVDAEFEAQDKK